MKRNLSLISTKILFMLSINIPVYNVKVTDLVWELKSQAEKLNIPFEIRVYDDGSQPETKTVNRKLAEESAVVYRELEKNAGRAAIRNRMGEEAQFKHLLFIDADSKIVSNNYLKNYLIVATPGCVLCGGTVYQKQKPADAAKMLRWVYGTNREAISAEKRNNAKGFIITSNNFFIEKSTFEQVRFRENVKGYGHEDTLLGFDLSLLGIEIRHIDNPLQHTGLEDAETFLEKTKTALENLKIISEQLLNGDKIFTGQVAFLRRYKSITRWLPPAILRWSYKIGNRLLEKNLTGGKPNLFFFDLYKLGYYSTLKKTAGK